ncbi:DUF3368 domain-containing protein [Catalinimonas niigatensis]|uniref:DUF3368 domain-containing protein n=1 Tax=Catalinimonas niigatensis TaxID=1397264 RepID=UPI0026660F14|nr:DUF3368 domain-containing protein [Catalinimonas niigatensis]WPP52940.1 DUF3368 domain-containing protein [Catalinimonas niigatensis]
MSNQIIIADTSCLIGLKNINQIGLLKQLYDKITITNEIRDEFSEVLPEWIVVENVTDRVRLSILELELDKGEASAIALALENSNSLLIIDEGKGRRVAARLGIKKIGTLGVFIQAKEKGIVTQIEPLIRNLKKVDFRISDKLVEGILKRVGER